MRAKALRPEKTLVLKHSVDSRLIHQVLVLFKAEYAGWPLKGVGSEMQHRPASLQACFETAQPSPAFRHIQPEIARDPFRQLHDPNDICGPCAKKSGTEIW